MASLSHFTILQCEPLKLYYSSVWEVKLYYSTVWRLASFASKPHEIGSLSNCWKSLGQSGITVPSGECLGCPHCAAGQCEGSSGIFFGIALSCKTLGLGFLQPQELPPPLRFEVSGLPSENSLGALTLPLSTVSAPSTLSLGDSFSKLPLGCSTVAFIVSIFQSISAIVAVIRDMEHTYYLYYIHFIEIF